MDAKEKLITSMTYGFDISEYDENESKEKESVLEDIAFSMKTYKEDHEHIDIVNDRNMIKNIVEDNIEKIIDEIIDIYDQIS